MMEASTSFLCHGVYGKLDEILSEDAIYGNSWCQGGYTNGCPPTDAAHIDRREDDEGDIPETLGCNSLLDDDIDMERQHYRILSSHQDTSEALDDPQGLYGITETYSDPPAPSEEHGHNQLPLPFPTSMSESTQHLPSSDVVLKEAIMEELQDHLPFCKRGESFWLQYSMVRDGASLSSLLAKVSDSESTILAIETVEGEVFGAFCSLPWRLSQDYYGSGQSFLWRLNEEEEVQVFKFAILNHNIQLCQPDRLIVGGGSDMHYVPPSLVMVDSSSTTSSVASLPICSDTNLEWGFGLWLENDLLRGSSSPCLTFQSPSLSKIHSDGTPFEIRNLEVWALTPCISVEQALETQRQRRFLSGAFVPGALSLTTGSGTPSLFGLSEK